MARYVTRRVMLSVITLWLICTIVFVIVNVLPNNVGRSLAGPFAPQETVDQINERLGTDDPLITQYVRLLKNTVTFDFGDSFAQSRPVSEVIGDAFWRSAKLVVLALIMTIPVAIAAGVFAARRKDTIADRGVVTLGLASSSIPDFVSGVVLAYVFGVLLGWFPVRAQAPDGASPLTQLRHLFLPALALVIVYFGYIARITRAGVTKALEADYTRTATMKGLTNRQILNRHVLRNGLQPTVAVVGIQIGYLFGSLVALERIFSYPGLGSTIFNAAARKDIPVLPGRGHPGRHHLHAHDAGRRPHHRLDEPPGPSQPGGHVTILPEGMEVSPEEPLGPSVSSGGPPASLELARVERKQARKEQWRLLRRRPGFIVGSLILLFWLVCAIGGDRITPFDPINDLGIPLQRPGAEHWFGTDDVGRDVLSRVMAGARDVLIVSFIAASIAVVVGSMLGLIMGYVRGVADEAIGRVIEAILSIPVVLIGLLIISVLGASKPVVIFTVAALFTPIVARTVRTAVLNEAQLDYVEAAKLRGESGLFIMTREILPNVMPVIVVEFTVRVGYAIFTVATLSFLGAGIQLPSPDWGLTISETYNLIPAGQWWPTLFPAIAIASLVIAVNLIADSIQAVSES